MEEPKNFSVLLRLQKVTTQYAYVLVPVTETVLGPADAEGQRRIDPEKFTREGVKNRSSSLTRYKRHSRQTTRPRTSGSEGRPR